MSEHPQPTARDIENAAMREAIAQRQNGEYRGAEMLALRRLGPGWQPSMKVSVYRAEECGPIGKDDPPRVPIAVAFKVSGWLMGERVDRFIRELPTGEVLDSDRYEDVFQGMLDEKHPTRTMNVKGAAVPMKRYQHYWSAMELYEPQSAEDLARLRASRERRKAERGEAAWREEAPLFTTWANRAAQQDDDTPGEQAAPAQPAKKPPVQRGLFD
jgi:hypothetical protein